MAEDLADFEKLRAELNKEILECGHLGIKRFFALDTQAYEPGALPAKVKELLGLVASTVLRCDDCVTYHLLRCGQEGWKRAEVIGRLERGPHCRRLYHRAARAPGIRPHARNRRVEALGGLRRSSGTIPPPVIR